MPTQVCTSLLARLTVAIKRKVLISQPVRKINAGLHFSLTNNKQEIQIFSSKTSIYCAN
jgi:hypothetical protein